MTFEKKPHWKIYLFGGFHVERDGNPVDLPPYRCHDVLAYLFLNFAQPIRRDRLVGDIFPDLWPERARARLSDHLWLIKSSLPEFCIKTSHEEICVETENIWLDCQEFSKLTTKNDGSSLLQAVNLYEGDLVPALYSDWILLFRERYRNQYLNSLRKLAHQFYVERQFLQAGEIIERLLTEEPFDESSVRQLMRVHVQMGRRGLAISTYEVYRLLCNEQLNVQPENETHVLYESIRARTGTPKPSLESQKFPEGKPWELIQIAIKALNEGARFELLNILRAVPSVNDPELALQRDLLYVDECIQWSDTSRACQLLDNIQLENEQVKLRRAILLIEQNNLSGAEQVLTQVLKASVNLQDRGLESNVLLNISKIKTQRAEFQDALLAINRTIHISTQIDQPILTGKGYLQKAKILYQQGANQDASEVLLQAQTLAQSHQFNCLLAEVNLLIGCSFRRSGLYLSAYKITNQALELARDTGMKRFEAQTLLGIAAVCDFLGRKTESIQKLETARDLYSELNDKIGLAKVYYNLAAAIPYHDENRCDEAIQYAHSALDTFKETSQKEWLAVTHTALAYALWLGGKNQEALLNYKKSLDLHKALGEYGFIPELCAYIGLAYLGMGNKKDALNWTDRALQEQAMLNLSDIVADIYFARGAALEASEKSPEAIYYYKRAYDTLLDYAKDIDDEDASQAYFHRDPITRRLMKKIYELEMAPKEQWVSFKNKATGVQVKRPEITLTIHKGPSDQALAQRRGGTAMRRTRLERMLRQAGLQRAKLSLDDMANALKVSKRTIQRDLVAIQSDQANQAE